MTIYRDDEGNVYKIKTQGNIDAKISQGEYTANSKTEPLKGFINLNGING